MKSKSIRYLVIAVIVAVLVFSFKMYNDYKEKNLDEVINYNPENLNYFGIFLRGHEEWNTDKKEPPKKLKEFLSQYKVKKMFAAKCSSVNSFMKENLFDIQYRLKGEDRAKMFTVFENCIYSFDSGKMYKVINGPIDIDWIRKYNEEYQQ
ncbi:hypothetical protein [Bacillus sp. FJAT-49736]|uniref:hypothetical protein n=1 Tax=Bacillus sp. FJAT-49736 TaxID=2833582 RepID=UPI001BC9620B|nr:hypothetical protein [Bacillus sp. FJAT-49736]MBS4172828.1 hypothetical protein [Bacillus sp. FJAT-49736]